jgi:Zn-dependent alcohol dehydrogenase
LLLEPYVTNRLRLEDVNLALQRLNDRLEIRAVIEF